MSGHFRVECHPETVAGVFWAGVLEKGGKEISSRATDYNMLGTAGGLHSVGRGDHSFALPFSGEEIRRSGRDGPYVARLILKKDGGTLLDTVSIRSPVFRSEQFGEKAYRLVSVSEAAVDRNRDGWLDGVLVHARVYSPSAKGASIEVLWWPKSAMADTVLGLEELGERSGHVERTFALRPGANDVEVMVKGSDIRRAKRNGPYIVSVGLAGRMDDDSRRIESAPYSWKKFR